nr:MAG TPA_asm: hypothetical protein [Caudoviricetes sp.]
MLVRHISFSSFVINHLVGVYRSLPVYPYLLRIKDETVDLFTVNSYN